jgi:hypothetical protein
MPLRSIVAAVVMLATALVLPRPAHAYFKNLIVWNDTNECAMFWVGQGERYEIPAGGKKSIPVASASAGVGASEVTVHASPRVSSDCGSPFGPVLQHSVKDSSVVTRDYHVRLSGGPTQYSWN